MQRQNLQPKRMAEDEGQHRGAKKPRNPETTDTTTNPLCKSRITETALSSNSSSSSSLVTSSVNIHRSLWPVRGANNEVTTIAISTDTALKPDFWPIFSLCGNFLPTPRNGKDTDQLPFTEAEIEKTTKPHTQLSDWEVYHILRLGLGRTMAKNHTTDLR